jgi:hypothetical protein
MRQEKKFDEYVETICEDFYAGEVGGRSHPPSSTQPGCCIAERSRMVWSIISEVKGFVSVA